ncbi:hypothetical protein J1N35_005170 [Gossypium stocksii]|uniref:Transmembrane protein n=1 Tax=Gossypium stocksii TaxID=47602 RepID=A0A9D3WFB4_9ROSI|nr:hypothetical protein J1N35_005170 [Gossypium stocksii]
MAFPRSSLPSHCWDSRMETQIFKNPIARISSFTSRLFSPLCQFCVFSLSRVFLFVLRLCIVDLHVVALCTSLTAVVSTSLECFFVDCCSIFFLDIECLVLWLLLYCNKIQIKRKN